MIKNISYELLDKTKLSTDILLQFDDNDVNQVQYSFIKNRLDNFNMILDEGYSAIINSKFDEIKDTLFIEIILSISDLYRPKNVQIEQIINDHTYRFIKFYERNIQIFSSKNKTGDNKIERN